MAMKHDALVPQPEDARDLSNPSVAPSAQSIARQLHITRMNAKSEADPDLDEEFLREFWMEDADVIEWAFREFRRSCKFMPAISEIRERIDGLKRKQLKKEERDAQRDEKKQTEAARAAGELVPIAELRQRLAEVVGRCRMPAPVQPRFNPVLLPRPVLPAVQFTAEEIKARKEGERAEIERYKKHDD